MANKYVPQVGDRAVHLLLGSTYECIVTKVLSPTRVLVRQCNAETRVPIGPEDEVSFRKNGFWIEKGATLQTGGRFSISRY